MATLCALEAFGCCSLFVNNASVLSRMLMEGLARPEAALSILGYADSHGLEFVFRLVYNIFSYGLI